MSSSFSTPQDLLEFLLPSHPKLAVPQLRRFLRDCKGSRYHLNTVFEPCLPEILQHVFGWPKPEKRLRYPAWFPFYKCATLLRPDNGDLFELLFVHITFPKQIPLSIDHLPRPMQALLLGECGRAAVESYLSPLFHNRPLLDGPSLNEDAERSVDHNSRYEGESESPAARGLGKDERGAITPSHLDPDSEVFIELTCYEYFLCSFICYHFVRRKKSSSTSRPATSSSFDPEQRRSPDVIDLTGDSESPSWTTWIGLTTSGSASSQPPPLEKSESSSSKSRPQTLYQTLLQEYLDYFFPRDGKLRVKPGHSSVRYQRDATSFLLLCSEFWLHQNNYMLSPDPVYIPIPEDVGWSIRRTVIHLMNLPSFIDFCSNPSDTQESHPFAVFRRQLFVFLRSALVQWKLEYGWTPLLTQVLRIWLDFIRPWAAESALHESLASLSKDRRGKGSSSSLFQGGVNRIMESVRTKPSGDGSSYRRGRGDLSERFTSRWETFVISNFPFYSTLLTDFLPVALGLLEDMGMATRQLDPRHNGTATWDWLHQLSEMFGSDSSGKGPASVTKLVLQRLDCLKVLQEVLDVFSGSFDGNDDLLKLLKDCETVLLTGGEFRFEELPDIRQIATPRSPIHTSPHRRKPAYSSRSLDRSSNEDLYQVLATRLNEFLNVPSRGPVSDLQQFTPFCTLPLNHWENFGRTSSAGSPGNEASYPSVVTLMNKGHGIAGIANELRMRSVLGFSEIRRLAAEYEGRGSGIFNGVYNVVARRLGGGQDKGHKLLHRSGERAVPSAADDDDDVRFRQQRSKRRRRSSFAFSMETNMPQSFVEEEELYHRLEFALVQIFGFPPQVTPGELARYQARIGQEWSSSMRDVVDSLQGPQRSAGSLVLTSKGVSQIIQGERTCDSSEVPFTGEDDVWDRPVTSYEIGFLLPPLHHLSLLGRQMIPRGAQRALKRLPPSVNARVLASKPTLVSILMLLVVAVLWFRR